MSIEVWHEHEIIATYPPSTEYKIEDNGALVIGGDRYESGKWSGVGVGLKCAYLTPSDTCPNCNPASEESDVS